MGLSIGKVKVTIAATAAAAVGSGLLWLYAEQLDDEHKELVADQVEVVKAMRDIAAGDPVTRDRITTEKVPRRFLPANPLLESELNIYLGTPVAVDVEEGELILTSDFSVKAAAGWSAGLVSPLVIKTAFLRLESDDPTKAGQDALAAVAAHGGYIVESDIYMTPEKQTFTMVARIPAAKFEEMVIRTGELGTAVERRIRGAGVSADVEALEEKIGNQDFLVEGLRHARSSAKKASKAADTIVIISSDDDDEEERTVRTTTTKSGDAVAQIDQDIAKAEFKEAELARELQQLRAETALSTVELHIVQPRVAVELPAPPTFGEEIKADFSRSTKALFGAFFAAIRVFVSVLPLLIAGSPILLAAAIWVRRRRREE